MVTLVASVSFMKGNHNCTQYFQFECYLKTYSFGCIINILINKLDSNRLLRLSWLCMKEKPRM